MGITAPVPFAVPSTTPIRIAGYNDPPFRIINLDVDGTVWVTDNPGLKAGQGTPIYPGCSLQWLKNSELWAIGEDGTPPTNILITTEVEDWQPNPAAIAAAIVNSGVIIIDNPENLLAVVVTGPGNTPATPIDITRFQSLNISIRLDTPSGNDDYVLLSMSDGGITTYHQALQFTIADQVWTGSVPAKGSGLSIFIGTASKFVIFISGSHRPVQNVLQRIDSVGGIQIPTDLAFQVNNPSIIAPGPGGTTLVELPPWIGELEIDIRVSYGGSVAVPLNDSTGLSVARRSRPSFGFQTFRSQLASMLSGGPSHLRYISTRIMCNGDALRINWTNTYAVAPTQETFRVTPIGGGLSTT